MIGGENVGSEFHSTPVSAIGLYHNQFMPALSTGGKRKKTREQTASLAHSNRSELAAIKVRRAHELFTAIDGCSSWEEIHRAWSDYSAKQKGDLFEELVRAFLQIEPEYGSKLKNVWLHNEVPQYHQYF